MDLASKLFSGDNFSLQPQAPTLHKKCLATSLSLAGGASPDLQRGKVPGGGGSFWEVQNIFFMARGCDEFRCIKTMVI